MDIPRQYRRVRPQMSGIAEPLRRYVRGEAGDRTVQLVSNGDHKPRTDEYVDRGLPFTQIEEPWDG